MRVILKYAIIVSILGMQLIPIWIIVSFLMYIFKDVEFHIYAIVSWFICVVIFSISFVAKVYYLDDDKECKTKDMKHKKSKFQQKLEYRQKEINNLKTK